MDFNYRQGRQGRAKRRSRKLRFMPLCGWMLLLSFVAGCAATKPTKTEPVTLKPSENKVETITHLENGRKGFVITENSDHSSWQNDFERSVLLMQTGKEAEAIPILEEIVNQAPGVTAPYINLAIAYRHAEQFTQAEEQLKAALKLVPNHPVVNNEYGLLLRQSGRFEEAREVYETTLLLFPEYSPVHRNLGILCELYLRDTACALEQYSAYIEANPDEETVALWIADLNLRMGRN